MNVNFDVDNTSDNIWHHVLGAGTLPSLMVKYNTLVWIHWIYYSEQECYSLACRFK